MHSSHCASAQTFQQAFLYKLSAWNNAESAFNTYTVTIRIRERHRLQALTQLPLCALNRNDKASTSPSTLTRANSCPAPRDSALRVGIGPDCTLLCVDLMEHADKAHCCGWVAFKAVSDRW
ncbi:thrombospondin 2/3/4/5 [Sarotherodon galilaeus]